MFGRVIGKDEDVVEVDDNVDVQKVCKDVVHKSLEGRRGIGETERHY